MVPHLHKKKNKYQILFYFLSHIPTIIFKYIVYNYYRALSTI